MNRSWRSEIRGRCFIIMALSFEISLKVVFTRYSGFSYSNLPWVCSENLNETYDAKSTEKSRRYDRLTEHVVYKGLQQC